MVSAICLVVLVVNNEVIKVSGGAGVSIGKAQEGKAAVTCIIACFCLLLYVQVILI